jgi:hypothetical protein
MTLDLCVLGRFELRRDGENVRLHPQEERVLAALAASLGKPVRREDLGRVVWGEESYALDDKTWMSRLRQSLPALVSRLRRALGGDARISKRQPQEPGFLLEIDAGAVDYQRFREHAREGERLLAAGDVNRAFERFAAAEHEWRGAPFTFTASGDALEHPVLRSKRSKLEEERRQMCEQWARAAVQHHRRDEVRDRLERWMTELPQPALFWFLRYVTAYGEEGLQAAEVLLERWELVTDADDESDADWRFQERARCLASLAAVSLPRSLPAAGRDEPLIGRERELDELRRFAASLHDGAKGVLLLEGEGGMGKTRLLEELHRHGVEAGIRTFYVSCVEFPAGLGPWREVLGPLWVEALRDITMGGEVADGATRLLALLGEASPGAPPMQVAGDQQRVRLVPLAVRILRHATATRPLLLLFDDVRRIDAASLQLLQAISAQLVGAKVGFVAALRHADLDPGGPIATWRRQLHTALPPPLEVSAFGRREARDWLATIGGQPNPSEQLVETALERSGGRPLLLQHVSLDPDRDHERTLSIPSKPRVPLEVRRVLLPALDRRTRDCRRWLEAAAVTATGQRFDASMVARMFKRRLDRCVDEARNARIVTPDGRQFENDLWRDVILEQLPIIRLRNLHARAFRVMQERAARWAGAASDAAMRLAHHALEGQERLDAASVAAAVLAAARNARRRYAYELAITLCRRGLDVADEPRQTFDLLLERGDAQHDVGDLADADASYAEAGELAAARGEHDLHALAALRSARIWWTPFRPNQDLSERLQAALDGLSPDAARLRAQLEAHLANTLASEGADLQRRDQLSRSALLDIDQVDDPAVLSEVLVAARGGLFETAPPVELLPLAQRLRRASARTGSAHFQGEALVAMVVDLVRLGQLQEARAAIEEHRERTLRNQRPLSLYLQRSLDVMMALWEGEFDHAEEHVANIRTEMLEPGRVLPPGSVGTIRQTVTGQISWLYREQGRADMLLSQESAVRDMTQQAGHTPIWRAALALLYCETGNHSQAADIVVGVAHEYGDFHSFPPHGWTVPTLFLLAEICDELHGGGAAVPDDLDLVQMAERLDHLLGAYLGEFALGGTPAVLIGPVTRAKGLAALTAGDADAALRLLEDASREATPAAKPTQARLHFDRARAYLARDRENDREKALQQVTSSLNRADVLGMARLARQAQGLLDELSRSGLSGGSFLQT